MSTISQELATAILRGTALLSLAAMIVVALGWLLKLRSASTTWRAWFAVLLCGLGIAPLTLRLPLLTPEAPVAAVAPESPPTIELRTVELNDVNPPARESVSPPVEPVPEPSLPATTTVAVPIAAPAPVWSWTTALVLIWAAGFAATVTRGCWRYLRFARSSRACVAANDDWNAPWQRLLDETGVRRRVPMLVGETYGPALARLPRGYALIVPRAMWGQISDEARDVILRHELAHFVRRDLVWSLIARWLAAPHWFNPLAHLAVRKLDEASEWACDDSATGGDAARQIVLSKTLLGLSESPGAPGAMQAAVGGRVLAVRIRRILETSHTKETFMRRSAIVSALTACLLGAGLRVQLVAQEKQDVATSKESAAAAKEPTLPKVPREELRYDDKSFVEWQRMFQTELKTERRTEAVQAMSVFAQNGYAAEATDTVLTILEANKSTARTEQQQDFHRAIRNMLEDADPAVVTPKLAKILTDSENRSAQGVALAVLQSHAYREAPSAEALLKFGTDKNNELSMRFTALYALQMVDPQNPKLIEAIRGQIADSGRGSEQALGQWMASAVMSGSQGLRPPRAEGGFGGLPETVVREPLVPILLDGLQSKETLTRANAQQLLAESGGAIKLVLPTLLEISTSDADEEVRKSAGYAVIGNAITSPAEMQASYQSLARPDQLRFLKLMQSPEWGASSAIESSWLSFFTQLSEDEQDEIRETAKELVKMLTARQKQAKEKATSPYGPGIQPGRPK